ncbi:MAG TPA: DUF1573 domain-containing protein [Chryseolinea sp.]|nr:DUF1573 domain-containing protein [Chryseolinea sp.]HPM29463.1 DUF1573 domain-containing protein [Chryseolinea sp.]
MKFCLTALITLFFGLNVFAQQSKPIQFREETFDFGSIKEESGSVIHEFMFTNAGNRPVKILSVNPSCGCTTPSWSKEPVGVGKTGFIQASFNPKGRPGYFNKSLTVTTDMDANPIVLQIKGQVSSGGKTPDIDLPYANGNLKLKSNSFNLGKVYIKDEPTVRDFPFLNNGTKAISIKNIVSPVYIKADVQPKTIEPGKTGNIKITYLGKVKNQYGFQNDNVEITTDDEITPVKSFSVYATLEDFFPELTSAELAKAPNLKIQSNTVDFGRIKGNTTAVREVQFVNTGKKELMIKALQGNCVCITAISGKKTLKAGEATTIQIAFNPMDRTGTQQKAVTVYSNDPQNPVQRIMLSAYVE